MLDAVKTIQHLISLLFLVTLISSSASTMADANPEVAAHNAELNLAEFERISSEAYVFFYPMLQHYKTMYRSAIAGRKGIAPRGFNKYNHRTKLLGPDFKLIVGPNNDTLYSSVWLDLRDEPIVLSIPPFPDNRYYSFQLIDMYVNNLDYIGQRSTGNQGGKYLIVGPDYTGGAVEGIDKIIHSQSAIVFVIGRTLVDGEEDVPNVIAIQEQMKLTPLSRFLGTPAPEKKPALNFPEYKADKATSYEFVNYVNFFLSFTDIHPGDSALFGEFSQIGITNKSTDIATGFSSKQLSAITRGAKAAHAKISAATSSFGVEVNGWNLSTSGFGNRESRRDNLMARAAGAMTALYGNDKEENSSFITFSDGAGKKLDGSTQQYTIQFAPGETPPAQAFWSLTMYQVPGVTLVENVINRYSIGDRTKGLSFETDGSLIIYLQRDMPSADKQSNWLPAPDGPFAIALRMYRPSSAVFNGQWKPPSLNPNLDLGQTGYDPLRALLVDTLQLDLLLESTDNPRKLPVLIYLPSGNEPSPVILFSHGLGGSRKGSAFLGKHWAARGYAAVFLQHPGSDISVWKDQPADKRMSALFKAGNLRNFMLRARDIPTVLEHLQRMNADDGHQLKGKLDLEHIGMSGHSFGAITTQAASGQRTMKGEAAFTDSRIKAALMLSPSAPRRGSAKSAFSKVEIPWMLMTGTHDYVPRGAKNIKTRRAVYPALPSGAKYELVLNGAEHSAFTERALPGDTRKRNPNHHRVILALSTAFWDTWLKEDAAAGLWLHGMGPASVFEQGDLWQWK